jgi:hypothetical protein
MAISNPINGRYYRVNPLNFTLNMGNCEIEIWKDRSQRLSGGDDFTKPIIITQHLPENWLTDSVNFGIISLQDALIKATYLALKALPEYADFTDVIE